MKWLFMILGRGQPLEARRWENAVWNGGLAGFLLWKISPLMTAWASIVKDPLTLIFLPGNVWGWIAAVVAWGGFLACLVLRTPDSRRKVVVSLTLGLGAAAATVLAVVVILSLIPPAKSPPAPSSELALPNLKGETIILNRAPGKVLFVNFWATWCPPCRAEIPGFVRYWAQADHNKVEIRAVDLADTEKSLDDVAPFTKAQGMAFPVLLDKSGQAAATYKIDSVPTTLVFDPQGNLVYRHVGILMPEELAALAARFQSPS